MRHTARHLSITLVATLMLVLLVGCGAPPAKSETPAAPKPAATALGETHPEWAKQYVIRFADGADILAGEIFDPTP